MSEEVREHISVACSMLGCDLCDMEGCEHNCHGRKSWTVRRSDVSANWSKAAHKSRPIGDPPRYYDCGCARDRWGEFNYCSHHDEENPPVLVANPPGYMVP